MPPLWVPVDRRYASSLPREAVKREGGHAYADLDVLHVVAPHLVTLEMELAGVRQWQKEMVDQGYFDRAAYERGLLQPTPEGQKFLDEQRARIVTGQDPKAVAALEETVGILASLPDEDLDEVLRLSGIDPKMFQKKP